VASEASLTANSARGDGIFRGILGSRGSNGPPGPEMKGSEEAED
jgi:hypothetical protein